MRPSWVEIDLGAIRHNVAAIRAEVAPVAVCTVVKADAYGHGDVPVARAAIEAGASRLGVALVEEGARLREAGIDVPILLLSEPPDGDAPEVVRLGLTPTGYGKSFIAALSAAAARAGVPPVPVHVKVNTGMHRAGADPAAAASVVDLVVSDPLLRLEGIWSHLAVADEDAEFTKVQIAALNNFIDGLGAVEVPLIHAANTAGAFDFPEARYDLVRVGLGTYGLRPAPGIGAAVSLTPAMRVVSRVVQVRALRAGDRPSYGRRYPLPADGNVVTIPIGYADGVTRRLSSVGGEVLIRGRRYPLAGTVTMDQIVVDVGSDPVAVGDEVVLLGDQGPGSITADEWASRLDTISYEVVCGFGPRLPRRYVDSTA